MPKNRSVGQLVADSELDGIKFILRSVELAPKEKVVHTVASIVGDKLPQVNRTTSYLWKFKSVGRRYTAHVTIRTEWPDAWRFECEYDWSELRTMKPHVHDFGRLNTRF